MREKKYDLDCTCPRADWKNNVLPFSADLHKWMLWFWIFFLSYSFDRQCLSLRRLCSSFIILPGGLESNVAISTPAVLKALGSHREVTECLGYWVKVRIISFHCIHQKDSYSNHVNLSFLLAFCGSWGNYNLDVSILLKYLMGIFKIKYQK